LLFEDLVLVEDQLENRFLTVPSTQLQDLFIRASVHGYKGKTGPVPCLDQVNEAIRLILGHDDRPEESYGPPMVPEPLHETEHNDRFAALCFSTGYVHTLRHD
jgi:hypothetical protein